MPDISDPGDGPRDIDAYIAAAREPSRATLEMMRLAISAAAPTASEAISYKIPTFKYLGKPLVSFAAWKGHCSIYPMSYAVIEALSAQLKDYEVAKGTIRFTPGQPLPVELVKEIVRARIAEQDTRIAGSDAPPG